MSVAVIVSGQTHPLGWVPTRLRAGDELGSFPGHTVPEPRNLASLYDVSARAIVEGNGVAWTTPAIEAWVLRTGGQRQSNGVPTLSASSVIYLPPGGPRPVVGGPSGEVGMSRGAKVALGIVGGVLGVGIVGGIIAAARS